MIVTLDADILGNEGDVVANSRGYAAGRNVDDDPAGMNRLYSVEPRFTVTGNQRRPPFADSGGTSRGIPGGSWLKPW